MKKTMSDENIQKKTLFVGFAAPNSEMEYFAHNDRRPQYAANNLQWRIIDAVENTNIDVDVLSAPLISDYPNSSIMYYNGYAWARGESGTGVIMPVVNLTIIKHLIRYVYTFTYTMHWLINNRRCKRYVMVYSVNSALLAAVFNACKILSIINVVIITDLPQYMNIGSSQGYTRRLLKYIDKKIIYFIISKYDGIISLTRHIAEDCWPNKPSLVMEGIVSVKQIKKSELNEIKCLGNKHEFIIMYAGNLAKAYGVELLLEAFSGIMDERYKLWICGTGELADRCRNAAQRDKRVTYYGLIPHEQVMELAYESDLMTNLRLDSGDYVKYSFPSKLIEYMSSGCMVLSTKLPGIPIDYYNYIFTVDYLSHEAIIKRIIKISKLRVSARRYLRNETKRFLLEKKTPAFWGSEITRLLDTLNNANVES